MAGSARPPARRIRRDRRRRGPARRDAAARRGLGGASRHQDRGAGTRRAGARVRHAPRSAAGVPAAQGRGAPRRRAAGRDRLRRDHLLAPRRRARRAREAAAMKQRVLGRTGLTVGEIGFGAWAIGGNHVGNSYGPTDDAESRRAVRRAFELGCTFFDTADVYGHGHSEELLGAALRDVRDRVILATKVGGNFYNRDVHPLLAERIAQMADKPINQIPPDAPLPVTHDSNFTPGYVRFALEQSLKRLGTDYIDVLQLHNPALSLISSMETYAVLEELKREGKIRWYGVSVHPPEEGLAAVRATMPDTVQIVYNVARREAEDEFFPAAHAAGIGVIAREPLANGFLAGKYAWDSTWEKGDIRARMPRPYVKQMAALGQRVRELAEKAGTSPTQLALRFVLDQPAVSVAIVGMKTVQQVDENLGWEA
ncbi:MAG: hypothetical protein DMD37_13935 [Gemmatimonadetes bacterium]|nr:MAG: hypothetical protein DMD37_13935 [Gemmatimonadota bacterium]